MQRRMGKIARPCGYLYAGVFLFGSGTGNRRLPVPVQKGKITGITVCPV
jgi:hypothetical protein